MPANIDLPLLWPSKAIIIMSPVLVNTLCVCPTSLNNRLLDPGEMISLYPQYTAQHYVCHII